MLTNKDIDGLMQKIQSGEPAYLYYVAHMIEGRETNTLDEHTFKDVSRFKVVKIEVENVQNAYFEYLNYLNHPENYHTEEEECFYVPTARYMHYFIVPNGTDSYTKDINARMPSIIYGYKRKIYSPDGGINDVIDPSPVKEVYTNAPEYGDYTKAQVTECINNKKLDWKYKRLSPAAIVDGIEYNYLTSDWYILTLKNYPMVEKPLVNVNQYSGYFVDIQDAFNYLEQLVS